MGGIGGTNSLTTKVTMKENKLGRKYANTWSPPRNRFATRMANKGVRKNAKLMIKAGEEESEGGRSNFHASVTSLLVE